MGLDQNSTIHVANVNTTNIEDMDVEFSEIWFKGSSYAYLADVSVALGSVIIFATSSYRIDSSNAESKLSPNPKVRIPKGSSTRLTVKATPQDLKLRFGLSAISFYATGVISGQREPYFYVPATRSVTALPYDITQSSLSPSGGNITPGAYRTIGILDVKNISAKIDYTLSPILGFTSSIPNMSVDISLWSVNSNSQMDYRTFTQGSTKSVNVTAPAKLQSDSYVIKANLPQSLLGNPYSITTTCYGYMTKKTTSYSSDPAYQVLLDTPIVLGTFTVQ